jgi:hypothetical protein
MSDFFIELTVWILIFIAGYGIGSTISMIKYERIINQIKNKNLEYLSNEDPRKFSEYSKSRYNINV